MAGRVGLPKFRSEKHLLSNFNKIHEPESVDALPLSSSSDEAEETEKGSKQSPNDSSGNEGPGRGDIAPATFTAQPKPIWRGTARTSVARGARPLTSSKPDMFGRGQRKRPGTAVRDEDASSDSSRSVKKQRPGANAVSKLGSHLKDDPFNKQGKSSGAGYGTKKLSSSQSSQDRREAPRARFRKPLDAIPHDISPKKKFVAHQDTHVSEDDSPSPMKTFKLPSMDDNALLSDESPRRLPVTKPRHVKHGKLQTRSKGLDIEAKIAAESQKAVFIMPGGLDGLDDDLDSRFDTYDELSGLSDLEKDMEIGTDLVKPTEKPIPEPVCPMCNARVDEALLKQFSKHARMNIDQQMRFCTLHRKRTARDTWISKGYPDIDWNKLNTRIEEHHQFLKEILEGKKSHFRHVLDDKVKKGKDRTLKKSEDKPTSGYYGPRGLRVMSDNIVEDFASLLRKRAVEDKLVSARGYAGFVQTVMVPELTVRLIMEDMGVGTEEARDILVDSGAVGELVNEDIADVVLSDKGSDADDASGLSDV